MRLGENIIALISYTNLNRTQKKAASSMEKISSGFKINSVKDDASGLAIAAKLTTQLAGLQLAGRNTLDGISLVQTTDGALNEIHQILQRIRELAVQAASDSNTTEDRIKIQSEINELAAEINGISDRTEFNKIKLLTGSAGYSKASLQNGIYSVLTDVVLVSEGMPVGDLYYQIDNVGTPAQIKGSVMAGMIFSDELVSINGEFVQILSTDTTDMVLEKLRNAAEVSEIKLQAPDYPASSDLIFITAAAGSGRGIVLEPAGAEIWARLGLTSREDYGTDASLANTKYIGLDGTVLPGFGSAGTVKIDGNRIYFSSGVDKQITLDIGLNIAPDGSYFLKNGIAVDKNGNISGGPVSGMQARASDNGPLLFQIGPNKNMEMAINIPPVNLKSLDLDKINVRVQSGASAAIEKTDGAISYISKIRSKIGSFGNRLDHTSRSLAATADNTEMARSRIMDTDLAQEMTEYATQNILAQAGISIMAQANQRPQMLLQLIK